jgi:hypothetical protein
LAVNSNGSVGLGTTNPYTQLHLVQGNAGALGPSLTLAVVNTGIVLTVPPAVVTSDEVRGEPSVPAEIVLSVAAASPLAGVTGAANTNAEGGRPPMVALSPAFMA